MSKASERQIGEEKDKLTPKKEGVWVKCELFLFTENGAFRSCCELAVLHLSAQRAVQVGKRPLCCPAYDA